MAAASLRANSADVGVLLRVLSDQLADTLGPRLRVRREGTLFRASRSIHSVSIDFGSERFDATVDGPGLRCVVAVVSGGVQIRSEQVDADQWVARLLGALKNEAAHNESARIALERLVTGGDASSST